MIFFLRKPTNNPKPTTYNPQSNNQTPTFGIPFVIDAYRKNNK